MKALFENLTRRGRDWTYAWSRVFYFAAVAVGLAARDLAEARAHTGATGRLDFAVGKLNPLAVPRTGGQPQTANFAAASTIPRIRPRP